MSCPRETDLGVYVLGSLDGAERSAVEAHLAECASCRARQRELAPLPGLLGRLTAEQVEALSAPPPAVLAEPPTVVAPPPAVGLEPPRAGP